MTLLIGLIVFGSLIMTNLIIAIIVTDVKKLANDAKEQVLFNKVTATIYDYQTINNIFSGQSCCPYYNAHELYILDSWSHIQEAWKLQVKIRDRN